MTENTREVDTTMEVTMLILVTRRSQNLNFW